MKWSHLVTALLVSITAQAADDHMVRQGLDEVRAAEQQAGYLMQTPMAPAEKERVRYIHQRLMSAASTLQNALNSPGYPPTYPPTYPPPAGSEVELYHSDSCNGGLLGRVSTYTNCDSAFANAEATWAVKIEGQCMDISDIPSNRACELFKGASSTRGVKIFHSDSCSGSLLAIVDYSTDCQKLSGLQSAWAIEVNGQCSDISDMPAVTACERFKQ